MVPQPGRSALQKPDLGPVLPSPDTVGTWASTPPSILLPAFLPSLCLFLKTTQKTHFHITFLLSPELLSAINFQESHHIGEAPTPISSISSHSTADTPYSSNYQSTKLGKNLCAFDFLHPWGPWLAGGARKPHRDRGTVPRPPSSGEEDAPTAKVLGRLPSLGKGGRK